MVLYILGQEHYQAISQSENHTSHSGWVMRLTEHIGEGEASVLEVVYNILVELRCVISDQPVQFGDMHQGVAEACQLRDLKWKDV